MDTTLNVAGMDYFHLYLFVKALRTPGLSINSQNCMGIFRSTSKSNEKQYLVPRLQFSRVHSGKPLRFEKLFM